MGRTPRTASQHGPSSARGRAGGPKKEAAKKEQPIHERLYVAHTAAYGQSLKPAETSDPECTFRPNLGSPEAAHPSRSQAGESAAAPEPETETETETEPGNSGHWQHTRDSCTHYTHLYGGAHRPAQAAVASRPAEALLRRRPRWERHRARGAAEVRGCGTRCVRGAK